MGQAGVVVDRPDRDVAEALIKRDRCDLRRQHHARAASSPGLVVQSVHHGGTCTLAARAGNDCDALRLCFTAIEHLEAGGCDHGAASAVVVAVVVAHQQMRAVVFLLIALDLEFERHALFGDEDRSAQRVAGLTISGSRGDGDSESHVSL